MDKRLLIIIGLGILAFYANIWGVSVYILDESKNASCAREMLDRSDLIVPTFNGDLRTDKPPMHYYFMMMGYKLFGSTPFGARFFSSLMGILTVVITYLFAKRHLDEKVAFYSALVLLTALQVVLQFHLAVPDPYLICFLTLGMFAFIDGYISHNKKMLYLAYFALGLGFLTKGPIAVALPGLIVVVFLVVNRDFKWRTIWRLQPLLGLLIILAVVSPWYIAVGIATEGEWLMEFFFKHNVRRYTGTMEGHGGFFMVVPVMVLGSLLPFSVFLPQAVIKAWKERSQPFILFCLTVLTVFVVFFSFSRTILPNYPVPCYPFAAVLIGYFLSRIENFTSLRRHGILISYILLIIIAIGIPVGAYFGIKGEKSVRHLADYTLLFSTIPIGVLIGLFFLVKKQLKHVFITLAVTFIITFQVFAYAIFPQVDQSNSVTGAIENITDKTRPIASYRRMNPAFAFYLQKHIPRLQTPEEVQSFIEQHGPIYLISSKDNLEDLKGIESLELIYERKDLFENPTTVLLSN
ncbi:MAG: glycosyltransferase family 39 protein [Bacteroidota bacterium]